jgi:hypothetical protein
MYKILNLEFTDILSLEPVDESFRPIRNHSFLWKNEISTLKFEKEKKARKED